MLLAQHKTVPSKGITSTKEDTSNTVWLVPSIRLTSIHLGLALLTALHNSTPEIIGTHLSRWIEIDIVESNVNVKERVSRRPY